MRNARDGGSRQAAGLNAYTDAVNDTDSLERVLREVLDDVILLAQESGKLARMPAKHGCYRGRQESYIRSIYDRIEMVGDREGIDTPMLIAAANNRLRRDFPGSPAFALPAFLQRRLDAAA